jgi:hypothetical protein
MAAIKLRLCLTKWQGACSPRKLPWKGVLHFAVSAHSLGNKQNS